VSSWGRGYRSVANDVADVKKYYSLQAQLANNGTVMQATEELLERPDHDGKGKGTATAAAALAILRSTRSYLLEHFAHIPIILRPTDSSARKAKEVFGIPELLETILLHLCPRELISAQRINKTINATVSTSAKAQRIIFLKPDSSAFFSTPDYIRCIRFRHEWDYSGMPKIINGHGDASFVRITVGSRIRERFPKPQMRETLICQPPVSNITASMACCNGQFSDYMDDSDFETVRFTRTSGITIGDIVDLTAELQTKHRLCPKAPDWTLNKKDGTVSMDAHFKAHITLRSDDPLVI